MFFYMSIYLLITNIETENDKENHFVRYANDVNDKFINDVMNMFRERHTVTSIKRALGRFPKILQI